jgi:hypothetical protein
MDHHCHADPHTNEGHSAEPLVTLLIFFLISRKNFIPLRVLININSADQRINLLGTIPNAIESLSAYLCYAEDKHYPKSIAFDCASD